MKAAFGPTSPPKPGSARDRLFKDLHKKAGMEEPPPASPAPKPTDQPEPSVPTAEPGEGDDPAPEPGSPSPDKPAPEKALSPEEKKKVSPWKLVDQYKNRLAELEKEMADFKTNGIAKDQATQLNERLTKAEARAKELEDEIIYVNYSKSKEFVDQFQKPYDAAWQQAMADLKELTIEDPATQQRRAVQVEDFLALVNMPLGQARELAEQLFGKFADDVMTHRKEVRRLWDAQSAKLEEAKKNGAERERQRMQQYQAQTTDIAKNVVAIWQKENQALATSTEWGKYFQPVEGDTEGNQRLAKGFELVDRAFGENPNDPRLTAEQRLAVVKRHAAVRNRAAAFGRLRAQNESQTKEIAALKKELEALKSSEPPTTGGNRQQTQPGSRTARDDVFAALHKLAR